MKPHDVVAADTGRADARDEPLLAVRDLAMAYAGRGGRAPVQVLRDVSFELAAGETLGIVGESGSGKSTLAAALVRLLAPGARILGGTMRFDGRDLLTLTAREMQAIRGREIATILQDPLNSLNPLMRIGDQVAEAPRVHQGLSREAGWRRAEDLIAAVRIASPKARLAEYPHQLSGGMRQRVAGAIALSSSPRLLIADEPTTALDPTVQAQYLQLLKDLQREHGFALILITHDLGVVARVCDRVGVMYAGTFVETGPTLATLRAPAHPYTQALLASLPRRGPRAAADADGRAAPLATIAGQPPNPAALPSGCAFRPRCPRAMARCADAVPALRAIAADAPIGGPTRVADTPVARPTTAAGARQAACWLLDAPATAAGRASDAGGRP